MIAAAGPFGLGPLELGLIVLVLLLLFGTTRLAGLGKGMGEGIREFRKNVKDEEPAASPESAAPGANGAATQTIGTPEAISALKCPSCGTLNPVGARHCNNCGTSIASPVTPSP